MDERKYAILFAETILAARRLSEIGVKPCAAREAAGVLTLVAPSTVTCYPARKPPLFCSLPRGRKGPHVWLNPR